MADNDNTFNSVAVVWGSGLPASADSRKWLCASYRQEHPVLLRLPASCNVHYIQWTCNYQFRKANKQWNWSTFGMFGEA